MKNIIKLVIVCFLCLNCAEQEDIKTINTQQLKELLSKEKIQLVDVRSPQEIERGFIKTAIFANYFDDDFVQKATKILDKDKKVYLYCRSGNRSGKSAVLLKEQGFEVINVVGGYNQWKKENLN